MFFFGKDKIAYVKRLTPLVSMEYTVTVITSSGLLLPPMSGQKQGPCFWPPLRYWAQSRPLWWLRLGPAPSVVATGREQGLASGSEPALHWLPPGEPCRTSVSSSRENVGGASYRNQIKGDLVWENTLWAVNLSASALPIQFGDPSPWGKPIWQRSPQRPLIRLLRPSNRA